jgi:hypothetical protein
MVSWTVAVFDCGSGAGRRRLLRRVERDHPVTVPVDRYSTTGAIETPDGPREADLAWLGRSLYLTTAGDPTPLVETTVDRWERAALARVDGDDRTVRDGHFLDATDAAGGHADRRFEGVPGEAGLGVLYALAMTEGFRFRPCASRVPAGTEGFPDAFVDPAAAVDDLDAFLDRAATATGVTPTETGLSLLRSDPAGEDRFVYDGPGAAGTLAVPFAPGEDTPAPTVETDGGAPVDGSPTGAGPDDDSLLDRARSLFSR